MGFERIRPARDGIQPVDIDISKAFMSAFGNNETETSAYWIVKYCQERTTPGWGNFRYRQINEFYGARGSFSFNRLISMGYIYGDEDGVIRDDTIFQIDYRFVAKCYVASLGQWFGDANDHYKS